MWQIAVLARFEVLQSLLSSHERENVKSAVFELHGVTRVNAEIREEVSAANDRQETRDALTITSDDNSAHLERYESVVSIVIAVSYCAAAVVCLLPNQVEEVEAQRREDRQTHVHRQSGSNRSAATIGDVCDQHALLRSGEARRLVLPQ